MVIGYIRVSTEAQDTKNQRHEILEHVNRSGMRVDEWIEVEISSLKDTKRRRIDELVGKLKAGDTVIVSELSRIGRSTAEVIGIVNGLVKSNVRLIAVKQGLDIKGGQDMQSKVMVTLLALFSELERDLISSRTKEALKAKKASGVRLGRPPGRLGKSRLDDKKDEIVNLLQHKVAKAAIARLTGVSRVSINRYINTRHLMATVKDSARAV